MLAQSDLYRPVEKQLTDRIAIVNPASFHAENSPVPLDEPASSMLAGPLLLGIETSGKAGSVALRSLTQIDRCESIDLPADLGSARTLAPAIEKLLADNRCRIADIAAMAVISGPGSFTGLRVGIATAKALCYARKIPLVEIDAMDVLASQALTSFRESSMTPKRFFTVMDAYRGQVFFAEYSLAPLNASLANIRPTQIIDIERFVEPEIARSILGEPHSPLVYVGPGCERLRKFLSSDDAVALLQSSADAMASLTPEMVRQFAAEMVEIPISPHAAIVSELAVAKLRSGETVDPFAISPKYYRSSAAEEKRGSTSF